MSEKKGERPTVAIDLDGTLVDATIHATVLPLPHCLPLLRKLTDPKAGVFGAIEFVLWTNADKSRVDAFLRTLLRSEPTLWAWLQMLEKHTASNTRYNNARGLPEDVWTQARSLHRTQHIKVPAAIGATAIIDDENLPTLTEERGLNWATFQSTWINALLPVPQIHQLLLEIIAGHSG